MTYIETIVTITAIASVGNFLLQASWLKWSYNIHKRKHFTDEKENMKISDIKEGNMYLTDYPILTLGDKEGEIAPMRRCMALWNSNDKYIDIAIKDNNNNTHIETIKSGYIYEIKEK